MATRCQFENSNEIGVFANVTNSYALCAIGGSENFYSVFEQELADHVPVVHTSVNGGRFIGRVTVGKSSCKRNFTLHNDFVIQLFLNLQAIKGVFWYPAPPLIMN